MLESHLQFGSLNRVVVWLCIFSWVTFSVVCISGWIRNPFHWCRMHQPDGFASGMAVVVKVWHQMQVFLGYTTLQNFYRPMLRRYRKQHRRYCANLHAPVPGCHIRNKNGFLNDFAIIFQCSPTDFTVVWFYDNNARVPALWQPPWS